MGTAIPLPFILLPRHDKQLQCAAIIALLAHGLLFAGLAFTPDRSAPTLAANQALSLLSLSLTQPVAEPLPPVTENIAPPPDPQPVVEPVTPPIPKAAISKTKPLPEEPPAPSKQVAKPVQKTAPATPPYAIAQQARPAQIPVTSDARFRTPPPAPEYPRRALRRKQEGTVIIQALVDTYGQTEKLRISRSSHHPLLDTAALEAVSKWEFQPAMQGSTPIISWIEVPIEFRIQ